MILSVSDVQKELVNLLVYFDTICNKHKIPYWIDGGTLLGAIRNEKIIAWDDDIDVCVLDKDYEFLIAFLKEEVKLTKDYLLYNSHRKHKHFTDYLANSKFIKIKNLLPIKIDIISIKKIENSPNTINKDRRIVNIIKYFINTNYKSDIDKNQPENKFLLNPKLKKRHLFYDYLMNDYVKNLPKNVKNPIYNYVFNDAYVKKTRDYYSHSDIFPLQKIKFEGHEFWAPNNPNRYLTTLYGEQYIVPPPVKQQLSYSKKSIRLFLPRGFVKVWLYIIYYLKEIKNNYITKRKPI